MTASRIARVEALPLRYPEPHDRGRDRHITLVRMETDDGVVGWGECISQWPEAGFAVKALIDRGFAEILIGEDPSRPKDRYAALAKRTYWHGRGGIASFAISAMDMAVWDIAGKIAGLPVHALLGQVDARRELRACASIILDTLDLEHTRDQFADFRTRGYTAVKGGWGLDPQAGFGFDIERDVAIASTIREAVGSEVDIALDVSALAGWDADQAISTAMRLAEFDLAWLEDALPHDDLAAWAQLRAAAPMPLTTGERCWTVADYRRLAESGSLDLVLIDPGRVEGISGMLAAALEVGARGVGVVPHSWSSAINTAAALHVLAVAPTTHVFELKPDPSPMQHELITSPFMMVGGTIAVPQAPGLGIDVDEDAVRRYAHT
jgi:L-alanine-DL-glutamate epimerase-like enolase superfamily enzyme